MHCKARLVYIDATVKSSSSWITKNVSNSHLYFCNYHFGVMHMALCCYRQAALISTVLIRDRAIGLKE